MACLKDAVEQEPCQPRRPERHSDSEEEGPEASPNGDPMRLACCYVSRPSRHAERSNSLQHTTYSEYSAGLACQMPFGETT